jgi:hypothetical protein
MCLLAGASPRLDPGWTLKLVPECAELEHLQAAPRQVLVGFLHEPEERLLWKLPEPDFTLGVLWACWRGSGVRGPSYYALEAGALPGMWVLGHGASGTRQHGNPLATGRLCDFLALVDDAIQAIEDPAPRLSKPLESLTAFELMEETFRAARAGDEERQQAVLAARFARPAEDVEA